MTAAVNVANLIDALDVPAPANNQMLDTAKGELEVAKAFEITDHDMYGLAGETLANLKRDRLTIEAKRDQEAAPYMEVKRRAESVRKSIFEFYDLVIANYKNAEDVLTKRCVVYLDDQRRKREEAERAARAEQQRIERENAERERQARVEAQRLEEEAAQALAAGNAIEAAQLEASATQAAQDAEYIAAATPIFAPPVEYVPEPPKIAGVSFAKKWKGRLCGVTDSELVASKSRLIRFVAANPQFDNLLDVNEPALNKIADSLRSAMQIDGCEAYQDTHSRRS